MGKKIEICKLSCSPISLMLGLIVFVFLLTLGNWQIKRREEKIIFIETIDKNITNPAVEIESLGEGASHYSKVKIKGKFLPEQNIFLYGRRSASPEKDGYYLLSSFISDDGVVYLVSRGWLPRSVKNNLDDSNLSSESQTIEAIILPGEDNSIFIPKNDSEKKIWFTLDLSMASEILGVNSGRFYLMQIGARDLPVGAKPLNTNRLNKVRNDHLEYAVTWYSLAFAWLIIFIIRTRKKT